MHLTKEEQLLATGKIPALFRKFAIPGVIGLLFIGLQPMIDGAVLGNYVGTEALASISIFVPIYTFMTALAVVVGVGCQAIVSMSLGSKDYTRAHSAFRTAFWSLSALALVMGCVFVLAAEPLCRFLGANEVLLPLHCVICAGILLVFPVHAAHILMRLYAESHGTPLFCHACTRRHRLAQSAFEYSFCRRIRMVHSRIRISYRHRIYQRVCSHGANPT